MIEHIATEIIPYMLLTNSSNLACSYPPRVAVCEYADHLRTRYTKEEDNRVIETFKQSWYNDTQDTEITDDRRE
jgi:hypothetical protein